jgi:hypothetical protein
MMKRPNWALRLHLKSPKSSSTATSSEQKNEQSTIPFAVALIGLTALKESADAFPPLKSTVSGILHIIELSQVNIDADITILHTELFNTPFD